jgi:threonine dehydrogenase-like Zn-dependent dehydrogenase
VRAVVLDAGGLPELAELPEPTGHGALVHVRACGLCGSDVEKLGRAGAGTVLGHEVAGELADGTPVAVMHRVPCGSCDRCLAGHQSTCAEFAELRIAPGGFAERLSATHFVTLPDSFGAYDGIWIEPLACVLRAAELVSPGRTLVVGCGAIGLIWTQVLALRGHEVVAGDVRPERLAGARELGALVDGDPVSSAVVTAPAGIDDALRRLEPGGRLVVFAAREEPLSVSFDDVYREELSVVGSRSASPAAFAAAVELLPQLALPPVTTMPLDRFREGVELYRRGDALKVAFTP